MMHGGFDGCERDQVFEILLAAGPDMELAGGFLDDGIESVLGSEPHGFELLEMVNAEREGEGFYFSPQRTGALVAYGLLGLMVEYSLPYLL